MSRIEPFGLLASRYSMSDRGCRGAGWVVGIADVDHSGIGICRGHGLHIMRVCRGKRHLHHFRSVEVGGVHACFISGIGGYVRLLF